MKHELNSLLDLAFFMAKIFSTTFQHSTQSFQQFCGNRKFVHIPSQSINNISTQEF